MIVWICFLIAIFIFLGLDLGVFNKTPHIISSKEAGKWTLIWVTLSFLFSGMIYWLYSNNHIANPDALKPTTAAIKFITGYLIELSLSVDNIFVIAIIFSAFKIPMLTFEIAFLGLKFSLLRVVFTMPIFIAVAFYMEHYLKDKEFSVSQG